jgi:hypothetical protein
MRGIQKVRDDSLRKEWLDQGERATKYFFKKANARPAPTNIAALKDHISKKETSRVTAQKKIEARAEQFYQDLFKKRKTNPISQRKILRTMERKLPKKVKDKIEKDQLTIAEVRENIRTLPNGKSPGIDGIPGEFYKKFANEVSGLLVEVYQEAMGKELLPKPLRTALLTLIYKDKGDPELLTYYRPISLLTVDYKILAKYVSNVLATVLPYLINPNQTGFVRGRDIRENILLVKEIIRHAAEESLPGILILCDFEKAYDRIDQGFLFKVLERVGFGPFFVRCVRTLYARTECRLIINMFITKPITYAGGVKQGCPASSGLFVLVIELFGNVIRNSKIKGFQINGIRTTSVFLPTMEIFLSQAKLI